MVYLAKKKINGEWVVIHHTNKETMKKWDGLNPEMEITNAEFLQNHNTAHVKNGKIVLGYSDEEKAEQEKQALIEEKKSALEKIDAESGAGRSVRKAALDASEMLKAIRQVAMDVADAIALLGTTNPTLKENFDPQKNEALKILKEVYDPAANADIIKLAEFEAKASAIRDELAPLLKEVV